MAPEVSWHHFSVGSQEAEDAAFFHCSFGVKTTSSVFLVFIQHTSTTLVKFPNLRFTFTWGLRKQERECSELCQCVSSPSPTGLIISHGYFFRKGRNAIQQSRPHSLSPCVAGVFLWCVWAKVRVFEAGAVPILSLEEKLRILLGEFCMAACAFCCISTASSHTASQG